MNESSTITPAGGKDKKNRERTPKASPFNRPGRILYDPDLPITRKKEEIISAIQKHPVVIISGATGSGKTTQIPKFCLEAGRGVTGKIGCTQPRRIAAITVAARVAEELGETLGKSVGYKIRFEDAAPKKACIKFMTDGILLSETQTDRMLKAYDTLIVDEAHERSLNIDFTLGILRRLIKQRKDLKLIITSATIDTEKFSKAFDNSPVIEVSGRMYPVEMVYRPYINKDEDDKDPDDQGYVEAAVDAVMSILSGTRSGDILVFMPTEQDIGEALELIRGRQMAGVTALPLFARLSARDQSRIFLREVGRKIIVATNVAETSLTIPGIKYVVDTGLARIPSYSPRTRTTALPVSPISQSSANQRAGRCGRIENGVCIRLFDEEEFKARPFFTSPQILRSNLAEVILRMIALNLGDVSNFPFIDPPSAKSIQDGFSTLMELSAIEEKKHHGKKPKGKAYQLTPIGNIMAKLPLDPKLSRILIEAAKKGCLQEAAIIATALTVSDPRQRPMDKIQAADQKHQAFKDPASDFVTLLNIWNKVKDTQKKLKTRAKLKTFCQEHFLSFKRIREWEDIHGQILSILKEHGIDGSTRLPEETGTQGLKARAYDIGGPLYIALHQSLLTGYLAGIALKKEKHLFTAAKGQQVMIFPGSGLFSNPGNWIMAAEFVKTSQLYARTVANIDAEWLEPIAGHLCTRTYFDPRWEKKRGEVVATEQVSLFGLVIVSARSVAYGKINPVEAGDIFIRHALVQGEIHQTFEFMAHNQKLMETLEDLEHKTRKKDILVSEEDIFLYYQARLPGPFYDIRTFSRFIKEKNDPGFLKMTLADIQKSSVDEKTLTQYPDALIMDQAKFKLEYEFSPGSKKDGITLKVPAALAPQVSGNCLDRLVPGFFEEKIVSLIKALPKGYRVKLAPISEKAAIIATGMPKEDRPLFSLLSGFIEKKFNVRIPETAWSEKDLPDHLRMRISIRDEKGKEIQAARDKSLLDQFAAAPPFQREDVFANASKAYEITGIRQWDFPDIEHSVIMAREKDAVLTGYPGLKLEKDPEKVGPVLSLRLFKSEKEALEHHCEGIRHLFMLCFPDDFKALKKDFSTSADLRQIAPFFSGQASFLPSLLNRMTATHFSKNIRTRQEFETHARQELPVLFEKGREFIRLICLLGEEYRSCFDLIQKLSFQHQTLKKTCDMLAGLFNDLKNLVPSNFADLYALERIRHLPRFVACIRIRAQRTVDNPLKEEKKIAQLSKYSRHLNTFLSTLSIHSTKEKTLLIEEFFWLLEEYKISLFAPELKTMVKVSEKILDGYLVRISNMI